MTAELAQKGRILVVDDAVENVHLLRHVLKSEHDVLFALDGIAALQVLRAEKPDLILLDAMMPGMDGWAVCAEMRASPDLADIPIIFVTALDSPQDETRALQSGAVDFITKPVNAAVVRARVRTHLTLKRQSDLLRHMATTDGLTQVSNRRCFDESLIKEWRSCGRAHQSLAVVLADVDHFKAYNDHYGHQAGDNCLIAVARALKTAIGRPHDLVARYGGEEFVVLLPQEDLAGAQIIAERMLERVRGLALPHEKSSAAPFVTMSAGVAAIMPDDKSLPADLLAAADQRLYAAKAAGRNRVGAEG
jgi:diguanylate cyclase (GGDEF)-like protein